jgi:hypothetical protein
MFTLTAVNSPQGGLLARQLALAPDGKRFAVFAMPEAARTQKGTVHVTFLQNFLDGLRRRISAGR